MTDRIRLDVPDRETFGGANDAELDDLPEFVRVRREAAREPLEDVRSAATEAVEAIGGLDSLAAGSEVAVTAGSRGIHDMPAVLSAAVERLQDRGLDPFLIPAMGSHGGATAEGQRETLAELGITEKTVGCEIRSSMAVESVGEDELGRPVYAARDAMAADAILLANRIKQHTDFAGPVESGLSKMAVVGLGKHRGAESLHNAAIATDFADVIRDRFSVLRSELPIVGGIALVENRNDRAIHVEGVEADRIPDREPELLDMARETLPTLPVSDLDLLIVDEIGKEVSGAGMDTNVVGRVRFHGEAEPDDPSITRIYARSLTGASHGNGLGIGLADFVHRDLVAALDLQDTYVNVITSGEPTRAKIPLIVPDDESALLLALSTTGVEDPSELRIARIRNTLSVSELFVTEPVADDLRERPDVSVGERVPDMVDEDGRIAESVWSDAAGPHKG